MGNQIHYNEHCNTMNVIIHVSFSSWSFCFLQKIEVDLLDHVLFMNYIDHIVVMYYYIKTFKIFINLKNF